MAVGQVATSKALTLAFLVLVILQAHQRLTESLKDTSFPENLVARYPHPLKLVTLGYDQLIADVLWLQVVQLIGGSSSAAIYEQEKELLTNIVELDPHITSSYYFAAFFLGGEAHQPEAAASIIEKGLKSNPNDWNLPFVAGINQYLYMHNATAASRYYRMAAELPGAPKWLGRQAKILELNIPSIIKQINIWHSIYNSNEDGMVKESAKRKLCELWLQVYRRSPSDVVKHSASDQLKALGVHLSP